MDLSGIVGTVSTTQLPLIVRGLIIGFSIAAPVGPIGVLCIRRSLSEGFLSGLFSGLGAASADAVYGCIAAFGLTAVSDLLVSQQVLLRGVGGLFLCYLGVRTFLSSPVETCDSPDRRQPAAAYASTFVLTLTNPMTILAFVAIFAGLGLGGQSQSYLDAGTLVMGVFAGSALWWLALSAGTSLLRRAVGPALLRWVNYLSGTIIFVFGVLAILSILG